MLLAAMACFDPFPLLQTPRVLLRQILPSDAQALYDWQQDPQVMRFLGRDPDRSLSDAAARIDLITRNLQTDEGIMWGLVRRDTGVFFGTAGLWRWVRPHRYAEIGYQMASAHFGQGLMTEALRPVVRYGFETMDLHRIEANTHPENHASARVLQKLGFTQEALLRENWLHNGEFSDSAIFGLLRREAEQS